jgi:hypothetical protein
MNKREQLLVDALGENQGGQFARAAAAQVRRRRAARQVVAIAGVTFLLAAAFVLRPEAPSAPPAGVATATPAPTVEIMSDEDLLAQLQGQPVLILKDDTRITGVVFLDTGTKL